SIAIEPLSARSSPAMRFNSVDLPTPDSPLIATNSPAATESCSPSNKSFPPGTVFFSPFSSSRGEPPSLAEGGNGEGIPPSLAEGGKGDGFVTQLLSSGPSIATIKSYRAQRRSNEKLLPLRQKSQTTLRARELRASATVPEQLLWEELRRKRFY